MSADACYRRRALWSARADSVASPPVPASGELDRVTDFPARPAAYVRYAEHREMVIGLVRGLGWPVPTVYADAGQPGSRAR